MKFSGINTIILAESYAIVLFCGSMPHLISTQDLMGAFFEPSIDKSCEYAIMNISRIRRR